MESQTGFVIEKVISVFNLKGFIIKVTQSNYILPIAVGFLMARILLARMNIYINHTGIDFIMSLLMILLAIAAFPRFSGAMGLPVYWLACLGIPAVFLFHAGDLGVVVTLLLYFIAAVRGLIRKENKKAGCAFCMLLAIPFAVYLLLLFLSYSVFVQESGSRTPSPSGRHYLRLYMYDQGALGYDFNLALEKDLGIFTRRSWIPLKGDPSYGWIDDNTFYVHDSIYTVDTFY